MGKSTLIILASYILAFAISHTTKMSNSTKMFKEVVKTYESHKTKYFAKNGINVAIGELNKDTTWTGTTIKNYNDTGAEMILEVKSTKTKYIKSGSGHHIPMATPPLSGYRAITSIVNYEDNSDTVKAIIYLGEAALERPLTHALFIEENIYFTGHPNYIVTYNNPHINAIIHSNKYIYTSSYIYLEGFLEGSSGGYRDTIVPNYNPNHYSKGQYYSDCIKLPEVDFDKFKALATKYYGSTLKLTGGHSKAHPKKITFGTLNHPSIWYIDGDLQIRKHFVYDGYGMIFVNGNIDISYHSFEDEKIDTANGVRLMIFSAKKTRISSMNHLDAFVYSKGLVTASFKHSKGQSLRGQLLGSKLKMWSGMEIEYFPPKKEFIEQVFPYKYGRLYPKIVAYYD